MRSWSCAVVVLLGSVFATAQAPGVPIYEVPLPDQDPAEDRALIAALEQLRGKGVLMDFAAVQAQLDRRSCELTLPKPATAPRSGPELWRLARGSYVRRRTSRI